MEVIKLEVVKAELEAIKRSQEWLIKDHPDCINSIRINTEEIAELEKLIIRLDKKSKHKNKPKQLELIP